MMVKTVQEEDQDFGLTNRVVFTEYQVETMHYAKSQKSTDESDAIFSSEDYAYIPAEDM